MEDLKSILKNNSLEIIWNSEKYQKLSEKFDLPVSEIRFIDFNRTGVYLPNKEVRISFRARFLTEVDSISEKRTTYFALPVRGKNDTNFKVENNNLKFGKEIFGHTEKVELDTCDISYMRGTTKLNLNSRRRGNCGGCKACVHHYKDLYDNTVLKDNKPLKTKKDISNFIENLEKDGVDISKLEQIAIVTGLFNGENNVVNHIKKIITGTYKGY